MANCEKTMSIRTLLFIVAVVIVTGGMECPTAVCPPDRPVYNSMTGMCEPEGGDDTAVPGGRSFPPGPGTGGLRTEPDTDTSMADDTDPDAVDLLVFGLNGRWLALDNGRLSCIQHFGTNMKSTLLEDRECDHLNPDGPDITTFTSEDLDGMVSGDTITGTTVVCRYGYSDPSLNGIFKNPMTLTISADGKTLTGTYMFDTEVRDFSLVRQTVGDCRTEEQQLGDAFSRVQIPESPSASLGHGGGAR
jgi:hypothetical protein